MNSGAGQQFTTGVQWPQQGIQPPMFRGGGGNRALPDNMPIAQLPGLIGLPRVISSPRPMQTQMRGNVGRPSPQGRGFAPTSFSAPVKKSNNPYNPYYG